jgi:hypothetical protein
MLKFFSSNVRKQLPLNLVDIDHPKCVSSIT